MSEQFEMVAKTFQGLEGVLSDELKALGATDVLQGNRMVSFKGDNEILYKANFCCRTALRILKPFYKFRSNDADDLYEQIKSYDWEQLMTPDKTFQIDSTVYSENFRHSRFVTYRVKDAIADHFMEKYQKRPSIRLTAPDLKFDVHISNDEVTISLDSSGDPLYKRGWRVAQTDAPINEVLAAGIIKLSGWDGNSNFVDPMCGSGTFLIEAALIAANINPGVYRKDYAFQRWTDYDKELFESIYNDDTQERDFKFKIYGADIAPKAVAITRANVKSAGMGKLIEVESKGIQDWDSAPEKGVLVTNPPYGERIAVEDMEGLYTTIGDKLKNVFRGYDAWVIGYDKELFGKIGLKASLHYPLLNGDLECQLREYVIFDGSYDDLRRQGGSIKNEDFRASDENRKSNHRKFVETFDKPGGNHSDKPKRRFGRDSRNRDDDQRKPRRFGSFDKRRDDDGSHNERRRSFGDKKPFGDRKPKFGEAAERPRHRDSDYERRHRAPRLGKDAERPIVTGGRRNSWKRNNINESNNQNNNNDNEQ